MGVKSLRRSSLYHSLVITPTCQVCGTTLELEDGVSIEAVVNRGQTEVVDEDSWDDEPIPTWAQQLRYRFCGEAHMTAWFTGLSLPPYEAKPKSDVDEDSFWEVAGGILFMAVLLLFVIGAGYGFIQLVERIT